MRRFVLLLALFSNAVGAVYVKADAADLRVEPIRFEANGLMLSGLYTAPMSDPTALVIIVHGYGTTNVVQGNGYFSLRSRLAAHGIATVVWDKPGRGDSEGVFDLNQSVSSSAEEVVAAAAYLREQALPGAGKIGLWGISRAGWIAPLALSRDSDLAFWISVSGVDDKESFGYLLASNWRIEGRDPSTIDALLAQWKRGNAIAMGDGSYEDFVAATRDYYSDSFVHFVSGRDGVISEDEFNRWRATWQELAPSVDPTSGLVLYVDEFPELLRGLDVPVLALFGEKDMSVNWRAARALYERTIGKNTDASLTVQTFESANHNMHVCDTGGFREMMKILEDAQMVPGYYDAMLEWLAEVVL